MTTASTLSRRAAGFGGLLLAGGALVLLGGCVVQERVYTPPTRVYSPPPRPVVEADVEVRVSEAPPPLPDYDQPPIPEPGFLWTPGYWAWGGEGYYWVPGTWVRPPRVGVLWTPGYWGWGGGVYVFHAGYWGPHVGFYGGVNYGGGYIGVGFAGGRWVNNAFAYNTAVTHVDVNIVHNTYNETVINNVTVNKVSYNGGAGGTSVAPTAQEQMAAREQHVPPSAAQLQHVQEASRNRALLAKVNQGRPSIAATPRPGAFNAPTVVGARAGGFRERDGGMHEGAGPAIGAPVHEPRAVELDSARGNHGGGGAGPGASPASAVNATNGTATPNASQGQGQGPRQGQGQRHPPAQAQANGHGPGHPDHTQSPPKKPAAKNAHDKSHDERRHDQ
jgi:hypothetical protein